MRGKEIKEEERRIEGKSEEEMRGVEGWSDTRRREERRGQKRRGDEKIGVKRK